VLEKLKGADAGMAGLMEDVQEFKETLPAAEKERIVRDATVPGKITLCTRAFGRGVDFQVRDPTVAGKGGVHVVQTFMAWGGDADQGAHCAAGGDGQPLVCAVPGGPCF